MVPISALGDIVSGGTPSREVSAFWNGDNCWVTPGELTSLADRTLLDTRDHITDAGIRNSAATVLPVGSLLITTRATIGAVAIAGVPVSTNQGFKSIVPNGTANSSFYYHLLKFIAAEFKRLASGSTFDEISRADFASVLVPRPPVNDQQRIAEILDTADAMIQKSEAVIGKLRLMKAGLMHDLLTRGLDDSGQLRDFDDLEGYQNRLAVLTDSDAVVKQEGLPVGLPYPSWRMPPLRDPSVHPEQFRDSPIGRIPKDWQITELGTAAEIKMGQSPPGSTYNNDGHGVPLINGPVEFGRKYPNKIQWTTRPTKLCSAGDILFCVRGSTTGRMNVSDDDFCIGRGIAAIRGKEGISVTEYIQLFLYRLADEILYEAKGNGSTFPSINSTRLNATTIPLPSYREQQMICGVLKEQEACITSEESYRDRLALQKQGLMADLLMGKISAHA